MGKFQKKENEGSMEKKHEEGKESCEEVVEHADEGEIFMVKGVVVGLQTLKQEPPEVSSPTKEGATMLAIFCYPISNFHQSSPKRTHSK